MVLQTTTDRTKARARHQARLSRHRKTQERTGTRQAALTGMDSSRRRNPAETLSAHEQRKDFRKIPAQQVTAVHQLPRVQAQDQENRHLHQPDKTRTCPALQQPEERIEMNKAALALIFLGSIGYVIWAVLNDWKQQDRQNGLKCGRRK